MAIPFHSSVRIKLGAGSQILNKDKEPIGINVSAKTIKNKVSAPFRKCDFEIHFGKGIVVCCAICASNRFWNLVVLLSRRVAASLCLVARLGSWFRFVA